MTKKDDIILSLGGSLIVPKNINLKYLKSFKTTIEKYLSKFRFTIVCGGGHTARLYMDAIAALSADKDTTKKDMIGIKSSKINASIIMSLFDNIKSKEYRIRPKKPTKNITISAGNRPGCSTDADAAMWAVAASAKIVINLTNIDYVYDRDPKIKGAKKIKRIKIKEYLKIVDSTFRSGDHVPFDQIAAKIAAKNRIKVIVAKGNKLDKILKDYNRIKNTKSEVEGTILEP